MKLYHATSTANADYIRESGLCPTDCGTKAITGETLQGKGHCGIYGWTNIEDAELFAEDNFTGDAVIFEFEASATIDDPEFDGQSKFVETENNIPAKMVSYPEWYG